VLFSLVAGGLSAVQDSKDPIYIALSPIFGRVCKKDKCSSLIVGDCYMDNCPGAPSHLPVPVDVGSGHASGASASSAFFVLGVSNIEV